MAATQTKVHETKHQARAHQTSPSCTARRTCANRATASTHRGGEARRGSSAVHGLASSWILGRGGAKEQTIPVGRGCTAHVVTGSVGSHHVVVANSFDAGEHGVGRIGATQHLRCLHRQETQCRGGLTLTHRIDSANTKTAEARRAMTERQKKKRVQKENLGVAERSRSCALQKQLQLHHIITNVVQPRPPADWPPTIASSRSRSSPCELRPPKLPSRSPDRGGRGAKYPGANLGPYM